MIARIWHGTTSKENATAYEHLVISEIFENIERKTGEGFKGVQLLKREIAGEVEFTTVIWFEDIEAVKKLTGEDYESAYIPEAAAKLLKRYDSRVTHSELVYSSGI